MAAPLATLSGEDAEVTFRLPDDTFGNLRRVPGPAVWFGETVRDAYALRVGDVRVRLDAAEDRAEGGGFVLRRETDEIGRDGCVVEQEGGLP